MGNNVQDVGRRRSQIFWRAPVFADDEKTREARLLHIIAWSTLAIFGAATVALLIVLPQAALRDGINFAVGVVSIFSALALNRRGHTRWASYLLLTTMWLLVSGNTLTGGGIRAAAIPAYLCIVLATGLLLGERAGIAMGVLCALSGLALVILEAQGWLPASQVSETSMSFWCDLVMFIAIVIVLQRLAVKSVKDALKKAHTELDERREAEEAMRKSKEALRESENKLAEIFRVSPEFITVSTMEEGRFLEINDACTRMLGYTREETIGCTSLEIGLWFSRAEREKVLDLVRKHGSIRGVETRLRKKSGEAMDVLLSMSPTSIEGQPCLVSVVTDITERKKAESQLRQSEERFRTLFMSISDGFYLSEVIYDDNGDPCDYRYLEANPAFERIMGLKRDQIIGKRYKELVPVDTTRWLDAYFKVARTGLPLTYEFYSDEYRMYFETYSYQVDKGQVIVFVRNVTERKQLEQTLLRINKAVECSSDAIGMSDPQGRHFYHNKAFTDLFEYTVDELEAVGGGPAVYADKNTARKVFDTIMSGGSWSGEVEMVSKSRRKFPVQLRADAIKDESGKVIGLVGVHTDITDRKRAEAERAQALEREHKVREEFTHRLITSQEAERQRIAGELHDSLGQNLSVIKNRAQLTRQLPGLPPDAIRHLEAVERVVSEAIAETRSLAHNLRPLHVGQIGLTDSLEGLIQEVSQSSDIHFERRLENVDDIFTGNAATNVYRIVQEALNNLIKHSQAHKAVVTLERDVRSVRLRVADDGVGFDRGAARRRSGLGLSNINERVRMLGGVWEIQSAPGQGTRLQFEWPVADGPVDAAGEDAI